jgi:hypothetical protein
MEMPVEGLVRVDLEVRRREPLAPAPVEPGHAGGDGGAAETIVATPDEPPAAAPGTEGGSR